MNLQENIDRIKEIMLIEQKSFVYDGITYPLKSGSCSSKHDKLLPDAIKFWREWLSNPTTKAKFMKNWDIKDYTEFSNIFNRYFEALNNIKIVYYDILDEDLFKRSSYALQLAYMVVLPNEPYTIYVNCSNESKNPMSGLIHEIQHILYKIKPLNPDEKVDAIFDNSTISNFPFNNSIPLDKTVDSDKNPTYDEFMKIDFEKVSKSSGIDVNIIKKLARMGLNFGGSDGYKCDENENMSRIMSMRKLFNLTPNQNITLEMMKPYMTGEKSDDDINYILRCWISKGFPNFQQMINKMNQLALQQTSSSGDRNLA